MIWTNGLKRTTKQHWLDQSYLEDRQAYASGDVGMPNDLQLGNCWHFGDSQHFLGTFGTIGGTIDANCGIFGAICSTLRKIRGNFRTIRRKIVSQLRQLWDFWGNLGCFRAIWGTVGAICGRFGRLFIYTAGRPLGFYRISTTNKKPEYRPHSTLSTKYQPQNFHKKRIFSLFSFKSWGIHLGKWDPSWNMRDKWGPFQSRTIRKALYMDHTALCRPFQTIIETSI